jgi:hypothetical protein
MLKFVTGIQIDENVYKVRKMLSYNYMNLYTFKLLQLEVVHIYPVFKDLDELLYEDPTIKCLCIFSPLPLFYFVMPAHLCVCVSSVSFELPDLSS